MLVLHGEQSIAVSFLTIADLLRHYQFGMDYIIMIIRCLESYRIFGRRWRRVVYFRLGLAPNEDESFIPRPITAEKKIPYRESSTDRRIIWGGMLGILSMRKSDYNRTEYARIEDMAKKPTRVSPLVPPLIY